MPLLAAAGRCWPLLAAAGRRRSRFTDRELLGDAWPVAPHVVRDDVGQPAVLVLRPAGRADGRLDGVLPHQLAGDGAPLAVKLAQHAVSAHTGLGL